MKVLLGIKENGVEKEKFNISIIMILLCYDPINPVIELVEMILAHTSLWLSLQQGKIISKEMIIYQNN
jgi:hypothetical protein